jgi:antitoxin HigA-1
MSMKNPAHPGLLLKDDLETLGLTVSDAARGLGVTRQQLYNVINGKSGVTPEMALRLEKAIGGSADHWLRMQAAYDLAQLRSRAAIKVTRLAPKAA